MQTSDHSDNEITIPGHGFRALQEIFGRHRVKFESDGFDHLYALSLKALPSDEAKSDAIEDFKAIGATYAEAEKLVDKFSKDSFFDTNFDAIKNFLDGGYAIGAGDIVRDIERHYRQEQAWVNVNFSADLVEKKYRDTRELSRKIRSNPSLEWPDPVWVAKDEFQDLKPYNISWGCPS